MRIAIMGTGAVGGYFGAKLAAAGHDVAFVARGAHLDAMRKSGLRIDSAEGPLQVRHSMFIDNPAEAGVVDLVLFCVKSYDTEATATALAPLIGDSSMILSLQNGIENPAHIARLWGAPRTFTGVVYIGAQITAPGVILHCAGGKIVFGQPDSGRSAATELIERTLSAAGIQCAVSEEIRKIQWIKLLWNAPFCAISSLCHADTQQILESQDLRELAIGCMAEVQKAALTQNIVLADTLFDQTLAFSTALGRFKPSMLQDLLAGKPLEYEAFNGIVVKLLRQAGKPAPVNQCLYAMLKHLDQTLRQEASRRL